MTPWGPPWPTYSGQNVGARRLDRIDKGIKSCIIIGAVYSVIALAGLWLFSDVVALLFVDAGETGDSGKHEAVPDCQQSVLFPLALVNIVRFYDSGTGLLQVCHYRRRL